MADLAPKDMPPSALYESSIKDAYRAVRDTAAKSQLTVDMYKTEPRTRDAIDFDFETELRKTRRLPLMERPKYEYKTLKRDKKLMSGEPMDLSSDSDSDVGEDSAYIARRPYTAHDRETTVYGNRRYYSRFDDDDPDYFDYDLRHSIDIYRKPPAASSGATGTSSRLTAVGSSNPALWEKRDFKELYSYKPDKLLSAQLYSDRTRKLLDEDKDDEKTAGGGAGASVPELNKGLVSVALRTPTYWARRFESMTTHK